MNYKWTSYKCAPTIQLHSKLVRESSQLPIIYRVGHTCTRQHSYIDIYNIVFVSCYLGLEPALKPVCNNTTWIHKVTNHGIDLMQDHLPPGNPRCLRPQQRNRLFIL